MAHARSGDSSRGYFISGAIANLQAWYDLLHPTRLAPAEWGLEGVLAVPAQLFMLAVAQVPKSVAYVLALLLYRDMQRAEYRADLLGAAVGGTSASLAVLEKSHFGYMFQNVSSGLYVNASKDVFGDFRRAVDGIPPREMERVRRQSVIEGSSLDSNHPPTVNRINLLRARSSPNAAVVLSASDSAAIDLELEQVAPKVGRALRDAVHRNIEGTTQVRYESLEIGWY